MDIAIKASPAVMRAYSRLFVNRRAYTLQSTRPRPETGRHYYFRPQLKAAGGPVGLTAATIQRHLEGEITIGLYSINPASQRSKWVAIDADYNGAMEDLLKLQYYLQADHHKIQRWIASGWLRDNLQGTQRHDGNGKDIHRIREEDILNFVKNHPQELNLGKVDQTWFLDLVLLKGRELREGKVRREIEAEEDDAAA